MCLKKPLEISLVVFLLLTLFFVSYTQERYGIIEGKITDKEGYPLPGITVTIKGPAIAQRTVISDAMGAYCFLGLPSGEYSVTVELAGFETQIKETILVRIEETAKVDFMMKMSAMEEEVVALAKKPSVRRERDTVLRRRLDEEIEELSVGKILFNPPKIMKVGVIERIEVRISQNINEDLTERLKGRGFPKVEEIIVGTVMKVKLSGDDFRIESHSEEEQYIHSAGYTQWEWDVTPLKSGNRVIRLSVAVSVYLDKFGEKTKNLPVMEKEIHIKVNISYSFFNFIKKYWQWIVGTIIALLGLYLRFKKYKKKRNHGYNL